MPYRIEHMKNDDRWCVHKENKDKTPGELIKCHDTEQEAKDHMKALYANVSDAMKAVTDAPNLRGDEEHACRNCNYFKYMPMEGDRMVGQSAEGICKKFEFTAKDNWVCDEWEEIPPPEPAPIEVSVTAVKAIGDWEIEVCAVPFGTDRDGQSFDEQTDYMLNAFPTPVITYHHGVKPGAKGIQGKPLIIGKTTAVEKRKDGIWIRVLLDKTLDFARRVWEAAKKGLAVASSDSIAHLARLEVNGKQIFYDKDQRGRIAVWPLAGVSLWDNVAGNFTPASPNAIALPAMKAIYREAGLAFPEFKKSELHDVLPEAVTAGKRTREQALAYLITIPNEE